MCAHSNRCLGREGALNPEMAPRTMVVVKRKRAQEPVDSLWLQLMVSEPPLKRQKEAPPRLHFFRRVKTTRHHPSVHVEELAHVETISLPATNKKRGIGETQHSVSVAKKPRFEVTAKSQGIWDVVRVDDEPHLALIEPADFDDFLYDLYTAGVYVGVGKAIEEFPVIAIQASEREANEFGLPGDDDDAYGNTNDAHAIDYPDP